MIYDADRQYIALFDLFHGGGPGGQISVVRSRAIVLIHEVIHLLGKHDTDFGKDQTTGSHNLSTLIIQSCVNKHLTYADMAIVPR